MAKYIVPSKAASGSQTFSDNLIGNQITKGTPQLTNTNFDIDRVIPEKDSKTFKTNPFSDFLTLDTLNKETENVDTTSQTTTTQKNDKVKFKNAKGDAGVSLYGSLSSRILVSITNIITKYPSGVFVDKDSFIGITPYTANEVVFSDVEKTTEFKIETSNLFNPFDIVFNKIKSNTIPETENSLRNFYSAYKNYIVDVNGSTFEILDYTEPDIHNILTLKVVGNPFSGSTVYSESFLIRPKNGIVEEFYNNLDDLETQLLNRESNPIYTSTFIVPKDNFDGSKTTLTPTYHTWPLSKDKWNIQISGLKYDDYVLSLSDLADEIDDYKSNLIVRFLSSPQLFEFDTDDQRGESIFQLYGQSFDNVKKYIDNIAYMRNVSYDGINNLPDILLKNLSETLGLTTINLFDDKKFEESVYTRLGKQYEGESIGKNLIESEYEFYRRLLVNLSFIYKSKGTKTAIEFFLKFLGAPEPLIKIDEYVYRVDELPKSKNLESDIFDVIQGSKVVINLSFNTTTYEYEKTITTGSTNFDRYGYPVVENSLHPRRAYNETDDIFFQKGSGWYDVTLDHRAPDVLDYENSILTGRTKTLKTKMKPYTYGEDYYDVFRTLPGLDTGYVLESIIDNDKSEVVTDSSKYILNRKNIGIYLSPARAIDYDIWSKSKEMSLTFGTLTPQTGVTFAQFLNLTIHSLIKNSNVIKFKKNYIQLEDVFNSYVNSTGFTSYNNIDSHEFIIRMSPYWTQVIDQIIPATTLWTGGNLMENNLFGRSKHKYVQPCQPLEIVDILLPEPGFVEDFNAAVSLWGLDLDYIKFYPCFEIDGVLYSGTTSCSYALMTGDASIPNVSAQLYSVLNTTFSPDYVELENLWVNALTCFIDTELNTLQLVDGPGVLSDYSPYTGATGSTLTQVYKPFLSYEFFTDNNGVRKVRFKTYKFGPHDCSVMKSFNFKMIIESGPCVCKSFDFILDQYIVDSSTGNTLTENGLVYVDYAKCSDNTIDTKVYITGGTYLNSFCTSYTLQDGYPYIYYYVDDVLTSVTPNGTAVVDTNICCFDSGCDPECVSYGAVISSIYLSQATGNTLYSDNTIYMVYECHVGDIILTKKLLTTNGTFFNLVCSVSTPTLVYYQNDGEIIPTYSYVV
jgi:hypothetical protein